MVEVPRHKLFDLYLDPSAHEGGHIEVFVIVFVAVGLFKVAALGIVIDEGELVLVDIGLLLFSRQFGSVHGFGELIVLRNFSLQTEDRGDGFLRRRFWRRGSHGIHLRLP